MIKARIKLVGKVFAYVGILTLESIVAWWTGAKFGAWIGESVGEATND